MGIYGMAVTSWSNTQIVADVPSAVTVGQQYDVDVTLASGASIASGPPYLTVAGSDPPPAATPDPTPASLVTPTTTPVPTPDANRVNHGNPG
jgi:hypothetical protein